MTPIQTLQADVRERFDVKFEPSLFDKAEAHGFLDEATTQAYELGYIAGKESGETS